MGSMHMSPGPLRVLALVGAVLLAASCLPSPPADQPGPNTSMLLRWTVHGQAPDVRLCEGLSSNPVYLEIWENADFDLVEGEVVCPEVPGPDFFIIRFECDDGTCSSGMPEKIGSSCESDDACCQGSTEPCMGRCTTGMVRTPDFFFAGVPTCLKAVLVSNSITGEEDDVILGESGAWKAVTPDRLQSCAISEEETKDSCFDFGEILGTEAVNFQPEGYEPLSIRFEWEIQGSVPVQYGSCDSSVPAVAYMGYSLLDEAENEIDGVQVERQILACATELSWPLVPPGAYHLEVEGRNDDRTLSWKGLCDVGLTVPQGAVPVCRIGMEE